MRILLIDADSVLPNIALGKLSMYHKDKGDSVEFIRCKLPYYPYRKKKEYIFDTSKYDKTYCSIIFEGNIDYIKGQNIIFGGTGYNLKTKLLPEIENYPIDYSLWPNNNISYGFISRGCIRNCYFCVVPQKEGYIHQVNTIDNIVKHNKVRFLDNNILALSNHKEIFDELIRKNIVCSFNEGLDIRLLDKENSRLLSKLSWYPDEYIFAFDNIKNKGVIKKKLKLLKWTKPWQLKFYIYVHPKMKISDTIERIEFLKSKEILPYIMRDIDCWKSSKSSFYIDLAAWCNQPKIIKSMNFKSFLIKRHPNNSKRAHKNLGIFDTIGV